MEILVARLEAVTDRLEKHEHRLQDAGSSAVHARSSGATTRAPPPELEPTVPQTGSASASSKDLLLDFDIFLQMEAAELCKAASALAPGFQDSTQTFARGLKEMVEIIKVSQNRAHPSLAEWPTIASKLMKEMQSTQQLAEGPRRASVNHDKALNECFQGILWVTVDGNSPGARAPAELIAESVLSADLYLNRVIMEFRNIAPEHKVWVTAIKQCMNSMQALVAKHCRCGLTWNAAGTKKPASEATQAAPASVKGPPPPPPPPKPGIFFDNKPSSTASGASSQAALLSAIRGSEVSSGLRKVTPEMKTKNRSDATGVVKASSTNPGATRKQSSRGPALKELQQNRWRIENFVGGEPVVLAEAEVQRNETVYVAHCEDTVLQVCDMAGPTFHLTPGGVGNKFCNVDLKRLLTIYDSILSTQVNGKVNSIMLDNCQKVGVVFHSVVACLEAVNCTGLQLQCTVSCPTLNIDKTDGAQIFLPQATATATEITSSKASALCVTVLPPEGEDVDPVEHPIPSQFVSKFVDGKLITVPTTHI